MALCENLAETQPLRTNRLDILSQPIPDSLWVNTLLSRSCCSSKTSVAEMLHDDVPIVGSSRDTWPTAPGTVTNVSRSPEASS